MSSVLHPVGPERRGTYWRRRLVLVAVLVVLVVLVVFGVRALTGDAGSEPGTVATTLDPSSVSPAPVTSSPTDSPTTTPTDGATTTPTDGTTATEAAAGPVQACDPAALSVTLTTRASAFGPGVAPEFILTVTNSTEVTCTAEVGSGVRVFTVADESGAQVFSTADCSTSTSTANYDLEPGKSRSMTTKWSRQRTAVGCPTGQESVGPGTYTLSGSWQDVAAAPVSFGISA